jgi:hypothetical protein
MTQVIACLPSKSEALSSSPGTTKKAIHPTASTESSSQWFWAVFLFSSWLTFLSLAQAAYGRSRFASRSGLISHSPLAEGLGGEVAVMGVCDHWGHWLHLPCTIQVRQMTPRWAWELRLGREPSHTSLIPWPWHSAWHTVGTQEILHRMQQTDFCITKSGLTPWRSHFIWWLMLPLCNVDDGQSHSGTLGVCLCISVFILFSLASLRMEW